MRSKIQQCVLFDCSIYSLINCHNAPRDLIDKFATDYHEHCGTGSSNGHLPIAISSLPLLPEPQKRGDYPKVVWTSEEFTDTSIHENRGETPRSATIITRKPKLGRPSNNNTEEKSKHLYFQDAAGSPVSRKTIAEMSKRARTLWISLDDKGLAPMTFGTMTENAWTYFFRMMVTEPKYEFLLLCNDMQWKLRKWCVHSYSSWYTKWQVRKLKSQLVKAEAAADSDAKDALDDSNLIVFGTGSDDKREKNSKNATHPVCKDDGDEDINNKELRNPPLANVSPSAEDVLSSPAMTTISPAIANTLSPAIADALSPSTMTTISSLAMTTISPATVDDLSPPAMTTISPTTADALSSPTLTTVSPPTTDALSPSTVTTISSLAMTTISPATADDLSPPTMTTISPLQTLSHPPP